MEGLDRTYKEIVSAKDEEIGQLTYRLRLYQDQNKRLSDLNRTHQITKDRHEKQQRIDHLSQIQNIDSNIKSYNKQNDDINRSLGKQRKEPLEVKQQKAINTELKNQLELVKKKLAFLEGKDTKPQDMFQKKGFASPDWRETNPKHIHATTQKQEDKHMLKSGSDGSLFDTSEWMGLATSISTLREGINKEIFQLFYKSVRDGERSKTNSLVIFMQNWKEINMQRLKPYIKSYYEARNNLKEIANSQPLKESLHYEKITQIIPTGIANKIGRNNINQWILSTIQFTKYQKDKGKKNLNNYLLFLFRLLTIEYRVKYPMQGKSYHLDQDVINQLMHQIIKGLELIFSVE